MRYRFATLNDVPLLTRMNRHLVEDEQHRNRFKSDAWFEERMRGFLTGGYKAVLFEVYGEIVAYALYTDHPDHDDTIYLRQIFVDRAWRRKGIGREAIRILKEAIWPKEKRVTVGVLVDNQVARAFYKAVGFREYSIELEISVSARNTQQGAALDGDSATLHPRQ